MAATDHRVLLGDGPWTQMSDSRSPTARIDGAYALGQNVYPAEASIGEALVGRPGLRPLGARLGSSSLGIQAIVQFSHGGVEQTVAVCGGELYTYDWTLAVWTKVVTTANLATESITLSSDVVPNVTHLALVPVSEKLLVSDGVNTPFLWNGTTGSGGLTKLTNCPVLYGKPTVHQARLFGIKASDRRTMVWSKADDPTTGYEAGGAKNAWTVRQTDAHPLTHLHGTNQGLIIFRARSITMAIGDVGTDAFQSSDTQEAIDATVGTVSPFAVVPIHYNIAFLSADGKPYLIRPGATGVIPIWRGFRETLKANLHVASEAYTFGVYYEPLDLLLFQFIRDNLSDVDPGIDLMLVLDAKTETPVPIAIWDGWNRTSNNPDVIPCSTSAMAMVLDATDPTTPAIPRLLRGEIGTNGGYLYAHGNPNDLTFLTDDTTASGVFAIPHRVELQPLGHSPKQEKIFDRIDVSLVQETAQTVILSAKTPRGDLEEFVVTANEADTDLETHAAIGIDVTTRWIAPVISHTANGEQFGLTSVSVTAYTLDDDPEVP